MTEKNSCLACKHVVTYGKPYCRRRKQISYLMSFPFRSTSCKQFEAKK